MQLGDSPVLIVSGQVGSLLSPADCLISGREFPATVTSKLIRDGESLLCSLPSLLYKDRWIICLQAHHTEQDQSTGRYPSQEGRHICLTQTWREMSRSCWETDAGGIGGRRLGKRWRKHKATLLIEADIKQRLKAASYSLPRGLPGFEYS